jgi:DNA-binding response OmpR family regulator
MNSDRTILVIDDDLDFQFMVCSMLRTSGYKVRSLIEGRIDTAIAFAKNCDMVLLDIQLPGINGVELGKKLRLSEETLGIPIILLSGDSEADQLFKESKADDLLKKPFSLSQLMTKIRAILI